MNNIYQTRLRNLRDLVAKEGSRKALARKLEIEVTHLNLYIGKNPSRNIGERFAEKIELKLALAQGWLSHDHSLINENNNLRMIDERNARVFPEIDIKSSAGGSSIVVKPCGVTVPELIIQRKGLDPSRCLVLEIEGEHMQPLYHHEDIVIIDTSKADIENGEEYAIRLDGQIALYRLFKEFNDTIKVVADNPNTKLKYPDRIFDKKDAENRLMIIGKLVAHFRIKS